MFELRCKDVGFDCAGVIHGTTKEEVLKQAAAHASQVHNVQVTPEMAAKVATLIQEQPTKGAVPG
jgi:predicted small metal-binding protein